MKFLFKLLSSIKRFFGIEYTPEPAPEPAPKPAPKPEVPAASAPEEDPVQLAIQGIEEYAEFYEFNQQAFLADSAGGMEYVEEALRQTDWPKVVGQYKMRTLDKIEEYGTNMNVSPDVNRMILDAVSAERSKRLPETAPSGHGMRSDGKQG